VRVGQFKLCLLDHVWDRPTLAAHMRVLLTFKPPPVLVASNGSEDKASKNTTTGQAKVVGIERDPSL